MPVGVHMKLDPQWIAGFVDGEGCFYVGLNPHEEMTMKIQVLPEFTVVQHERDIQVLHALKNHFQCGVVRVNHGDRYSYRVRSKDDLLKKIIPFFEKHSLKTKKRVDFAKFKKVLQMMQRNEHLTEEGLQKIREITDQMNRGGIR